MVLDVRPETVRFIAETARSFQAKEAVSIPEDAPLSPADDWALQTLAAHLDDPSYQEAHSAIQDLEPDQQIQLVALMWLGRGDFDLDTWDDAIEMATNERNARTAEYLLSTPLIASYLEEALSQHGYGEDAD